MLDSITSDVVVSEVIQPEVEQKKNKNISYRGTDYERTPDSDSFEGEKKNNTGKIIGITASIIAAAALILGAVCYSKGKGADGVEKKFGDRMKDGWNKLWHKGEDGVNETKESLQEKANDIKNDAEQTVDKAKEEVDGSKLKEQIEQAQPKTQKAGDPVINEKENIVQTSVADSAEENVVKQETTIEANKPIIEEVKKPMAETVVQKAERSFEDIAKEAKENVAKLTKKIEELEKEVSQFNYGEFPGEKVGDIYIAKNSEGQVIRDIYAPNNKIWSITYYDPSRPKFETEAYFFNKSGQIEHVYQRIGDTNEIIHYYTDNCEYLKNSYSLEKKLNDGNVLTDTEAIFIERVKFKQGTAKVTKYDERGFEISKAEVALV